MEGSGIEGLTLQDSRTVPVESEQQRTLDGDTDKFVESMKSLFDYQESQIRISVEGFNTSADPVELYTSLQDLFKTCGEVDHIEFKIDRVRKQVISPWVVVLRGEGAKEKASLLDGSEVGGRKLTVSPVEEPTDGLSTSVRAARYVADFQRKRSQAISVTGYDLSLPQDDLKSALRKHFASCGEITDILVLDSRALVHLYGLGSVHRAVQLNGTDLGGGFKLTVQAVPYSKPEEASGTSHDVITVT
nr:PREDICTED: nucleolin 1-like [Raphanus sativus]